MPGDGDTRHGTTNGYGNLGCRCSECRAAWAADYLRMKRRRYAAFAAGEVDKPHGSYSTYHNWGCRCRPCTNAHNAGTERARRARLARRAS